MCCINGYHYNQVRLYILFALLLPCYAVTIFFSWEHLTDIIRVYPDVYVIMSIRKRM
jgi:hypothetical protein